MNFYYTSRDPQQRPPVSHCSSCGGEIYSMDDCELNGSRIYCEYCAKDDENSTRFTGRELENYFQKIYGGSNE